MTLPAQPTDVVVPIVTASLTDGTVDDLLGTGFMVGPGVIMSAKHVLGVTPPAGHQLAAGLIGNGPVPAFVIEDVVLDPKHDLAVGRVPDWPKTEHLAVKSHDVVAMNWDVLTVEYSETQRHVPLPEGGKAMMLTPSHHKGYVMRMYSAEFGHAHPVECIDVSYPAFKRASGAPVIEAMTGEVIGVIVANVERHLLPAHLERIESSAGVVEERKYFLPQGQAIRANHMRDLLECAQKQWG